MDTNCLIKSAAYKAAKRAVTRIAKKDEAPQQQLSIKDKLKNKIKKSQEETDDLQSSIATHWITNTIGALAPLAGGALASQANGDKTKLSLAGAIGAGPLAGTIGANIAKAFKASPAVQLLVYALTGVAGAGAGFMAGQTYATKIRPVITNTQKLPSLIVEKAGLKIKKDKELQSTAKDVLINAGKDVAKNNEVQQAVKDVITDVVKRESPGIIHAGVNTAADRLKQDDSLRDKVLRSAITESGLRLELKGKADRAASILLLSLKNGLHGTFDLNKNTISFW